MMEELAAYASMGAASVALDAGLLFTSDDDSYRGHVIDEPNFYHKKLTSLKRRSEDEDDMIVSLLTTVWEDELIACIAESNLSKKAAAGSGQPEVDGDPFEDIQNLSPLFGDHAMFQTAGHLTSPALGKRQRYNNSMAFANGLGSVSDERSGSSMLGNHIPSSGRQQSYLINQQSSLVSLQNSLLNQQQELINQIRQTSERLEHQFRMQNDLDVRSSERSVMKELQADAVQPQ